MAERAVTMMIVVVLLVAGATGLMHARQDTVRGSGDEIAVTNETWAVSPGNTTELQHSYREGAYSEEENVTVYQNGTEIQQSGNWTWDVADGTIAALNGTTMNASEDATVSYTYYDPTEVQQRTDNVLGLVIGVGNNLLPLFGFIVVIAGLMIGIRAMGGM